MVNKQWIRVYRQPWKALYVTSQVGFLLLIRAPFLCCISLVPALRPNPKWNWKQAVTLPLARDIVHTVVHSGIAQSRKDADRSDMPSPQAYSKDCLGVFVDPVIAGDIQGEVKELMIQNDVQPAGVAMYWYGGGGGGVYSEQVGDGVGTSVAPAGKDEKIVVHFHGGAYMMGSAKPGGAHEPLVKLILAHAQARPSQPISRILNVEYRLVRTSPLAEPANPFPAALLDALTAIYYLIFDVGFHPRNIILSGDSAGANVALSVTRYLRDAPMPASRLKNMPLPAHLKGVTSLMPGGMLFMSPWCDVASTHTPERAGPNCAYVSNAKTDYVGEYPYSSDRPALSAMSYPARGLAGKAFTPDSLARNPFVAPGSLDCPLTVLDESTAIERPTFEGYPPAYFSFGGKEILADEIRLCAKRLTEQSSVKTLPNSHSSMVDREVQQQSPEYPWIVVDEEPEMWHDFIMGPARSKESGQALEKIAAWLAALPLAENYPI
ncbi:alpha/beta-hydrolase [Clavulina sp. PMI_390]|nr:alpha/beta-hydrolase [Clavulina sp. PMI_390]